MDYADVKNKENVGGKFSKYPAMAALLSAFLICEDLNDGRNYFKRLLLAYLESSIDTTTALCIDGSIILTLEMLVVCSLQPAVNSWMKWTRKFKTEKNPKQHIDLLGYPTYEEKSDRCSYLEYIPISAFDFEDQETIEDTQVIGSDVRDLLWTLDLETDQSVHRMSKLIQVLKSVLGSDSVLLMSLLTKAARKIESIVSIYIIYPLLGNHPLKWTLNVLSKEVPTPFLSICYETITHLVIFLQGIIGVAASRTLVVVPLMRTLGSILGQCNSLQTLASYYTNQNFSWSPKSLALLRDSLEYIVRMPADSPYKEVVDPAMFVRTFTCSLNKPIVSISDYVCEILSPLIVQTIRMFNMYGIKLLVDVTRYEPLSLICPIGIEALLSHDVFLIVRAVSDQTEKDRCISCTISHLPEGFFDSPVEYSKLEVIAGLLCAREPTNVLKQSGMFMEECDGNRNVINDLKKRLWLALSDRHQWYKSLVKHKQKDPQFSKLTKVIDNNSDLYLGENVNAYIYEASYVSFIHFLFQLRLFGHLVSSAPREYAVSCLRYGLQQLNEVRKIYVTCSCEKLHMFSSLF